MPNRAVADAHTAAQRLHARLHTNYNQPVDIFTVVKQHNIWLATQTLSGGLYGFYLREGDATGIVLNADHPETLQRYTCAHELGHHLLGHTSHLDERDDIHPPVIGDRMTELAAQAFAGAFLMPLQAVNRVLRRLGLAKDQRLDAADVYAVSRELDVSYSAAAWQLATLGKISNPTADRLVKAGAAAAKRTLRHGPPPQGDNRAALFILDAATDGVPVLCRAGDELRLQLPENASTGHVWQLNSPTGPPPATPAPTWDGGGAVTPTSAHSSRTPPSDDPLLLTQDRYLTPTVDGPTSAEPSTDGTVGQAGLREFVFVAGRPGWATVEVTLARQWESQPVHQFATTVRVAPSHLIERLDQDQAQQHADRVAQG